MIPLDEQLFLKYSQREIKRKFHENIVANGFSNPELAKKQKGMVIGQFEFSPLLRRGLDGTTFPRPAV